MVSAIIVAAGSSRRMGFDKLFAPLGGKPVVWHSLHAFSESREVEEIIVVVREDRFRDFEVLLESGELPKVKKLIVGGAERARPLTTPKLIRACLAMARQHGAACCASPIPDTVKRASVEQMVEESVERTGLWAMQTPQVFSAALIHEAYAALMAKHEIVTDEVSAVQKLGRKIALLKNEDWNFKITFPHDLELAAHVIALRAKKKSPKKLSRRAPKA